MSSNKSFSTETSERYARALFELVSESSELEMVEKNIKELLHIYDSNKELEHFIKLSQNGLAISKISVSDLSSKLI